MTAVGSFTVGEVLTAASMNEIGAWTSYTPTWTNVTVGNGTVTAKYYLMNKIGFVMLDFVWGSTSSATGLFTFSMPSGWTAAKNTPGEIAVIQAAGTQYFGYIQPTANGSSNFHIRVLNVAGTYAQQNNVTGTVPGTFAAASNDFIRGVWIGEVA